MTSLPTTAFGSVLDQPNRTAAVLRARAAAAGMELAPASTEDLAAAVLVAHCWAVAHGRTSVTGAMDPRQAAGLARALTRAAGRAEEVGQAYEHGDVDEVPAEHLREVFPVLQWALSHGGQEAVRRAVADLTGSGPLAALGEMLAIDSGQA